MSHVVSGSAGPDGIDDDPSSSTPDPPMSPERGAVRAVVLTSGSERLEATLLALKAQSHPDLSISVALVAGRNRRSAAEAGERVAEIAARHDVAMVAGGAGASIAEAANRAAFDQQPGAAQRILFLHDEVALEPDAVATLVDGADGAGAEVAGPKILDWELPDMLRDVGMNTDRFGYPYTAIEQSEIDHGQHDGTREVLYVSTTCLLITYELFERLGGFDATVGALEEDLDLCWRARIAGATVAVVSAAVAHHAPGSLDYGMVRHPGVRAQRNRLRVMLKCYGFASLLAVLPQLALVNVAEVLALTFGGKASSARGLISSWIWNFWHLLPTLGARRRVQRMRQVPDSSIRAFQVTGSARLRAYMESRLRASGEGDDFAPVSLQASGAGVWEYVVHILTSPSLLFWVGLLVVFAIGARSLIFSSHLPVSGEFAPFPGGLGLWRQYLKPWSPQGFGSAAAPYPGMAVAATLEVLTLGRPGAAQKLLVLGSYLAGLVGIWRVASRWSAWGGRAASVALYGLSPVAIGAFERGSSSALVFFGIAPFILSNLAQHFDGGGRPVRRVIRVGLLLGVAGAFFPAALPLVVGIAIALFLASLVASGALRALAALGTALAGSAMAFALLMPWSLELLRPGSVLRTLSTDWPDPQLRAGVAGILRLQTTAGSGGAPWGYALAGLAVASLLIVTGDRLAWALRLWVVALGCLAMYWLAGQGVLPPAILLLPGVLVPAAAAFALVGGFLAAELAEMVTRRPADEEFEAVPAEVEEPGLPARGWRPAFCVIALTVAAVLLAQPLWQLASGRMGMPESPVDRSISTIAEDAGGSGFGVLWVGAPEDLPGAPYPMPDRQGGAYVVTASGGPSVAEVWPVDPGEGHHALARTLRYLQEPGSARGGRVMSSMGIRYIVMVGRGAKPDPVGGGPPPGELLDGLRRQLDIAEVPGPPGANIFRVAAESSLDTVSLVGPEFIDAVRARPGAEMEEALLSADFSKTRQVTLDPTIGSQVSVDARKGDAVVLAKNYDERLVIETEGQGPLAHQESFAWSNGYVFSGGGGVEVKLEYRSDGSRPAVVAAEAGAWLLLLVVLASLRRRDSRDELEPERLVAVGS